jgi:hypothetical protein
VPTFIVSSAILKPAIDPKTCALDAPRKLSQVGAEIKLRSCYCCSDYGSVVFVVDSVSRDSVLDAFRQISVPVASILEAEEIKQSVANPTTA